MFNALLLVLIQICWLRSILKTFRKVMGISCQESFHFYFPFHVIGSSIRAGGEKSVHPLLIRVVFLWGFVEHRPSCKAIWCFGFSPLIRPEHQSEVSVSIAGWLKLSQRWNMQPQASGNVWRHQSLKAIKVCLHWVQKQQATFLEIYNCGEWAVGSDIWMF